MYEVSRWLRLWRQQHADPVSGGETQHCGKLHLHGVRWRQAVFGGGVELVQHVPGWIFHEWRPSSRPNYPYGLFAVPTRARVRGWLERQNAVHCR